MTILVDRPIWHFRGERWSHLVSDTSLDELHEFAAELGIPRRAFHRDHYDIPERLLAAATGAGAELVDPRVIVRRLRAAGLRRRPNGQAEKQRPGPPARPAKAEKQRPGPPARPARAERQRPGDTSPMDMGH